MNVILPAALVAALLLLMSCSAARAQEGPGLKAALEEPVRNPWEGAIGLNTRWQPEYSGAGQQVLKLTPVFFLRYGRFTVTNASGFVTRRETDVARGLGLDLVQDSRLRVNLALRYDAGRSEGSSDALKGLGDIKPTVRARASASYRLDGPWRLGASWSADAFGRGGGNFGDFSVGWDQPVADATRLSLGLSLAAAQDRYMQTYYGITPEQSASTGYPVYEPSSGLRDVTLGAGPSSRVTLALVSRVHSGPKSCRRPAPSVTSRSPLLGSYTGYPVLADCSGVMP
jgi:MipA family protein